MDPFDPDAPADPLAAGEMPLRRLTQAEYANTVRDLFGEPTDVADRIGGQRTGSSGFGEAPVVTTVDVERLREAAEVLARRAVDRMAELRPCDPGATGEDACARAFVEQFGRRAFRRPLSAGEVDELVALYEEARTLEEDFDGALGLVIEAILQSPPFLYRWELGTESARADRDGAIALGPYEIASRLSYFLWGSMPDEALFEKAAASRLDGPSAIEAEARRMLDDPKAKETLERFHMEWLKLERLLSLPLEADLKASLHEENRRFIEDVYFGSGEGRLAPLFTADYTFMDARVAELYGHAPVEGWARVSLEPTERSGILTQPGFLATSSDVIRRGVLVREKLLCQHLPPPPPNIPPLATPDPDADPRERYIDHSREAVCRTCHERIDPIGFGFESFDSLGRHRTTVGAWTVDSSGEILEIDGTTKGFEGVPDLARTLFESAEVKQCVAKQFFRFGFARKETSGDVFSIRSAFDRFAAADFDVRELLVAYVTSRTFLYRMPSEGEVVR